MKIIALRGGENTGKSHVINIVYQFLLSEEWSQVQGHFRELGNPIYNDMIDILSKENILLGIIGAGDYQIGDMGLKNLIGELENKGCQIIICACRNNPKIEKTVYNYPDHNWIDKTLSNGRYNDRIVNGIDAQTIVSIVNKLVI